MQIYSYTDTGTFAAIAISAGMPTPSKVKTAAVPSSCDFVDEAEKDRCETVDEGDNDASPSPVVSRSEPLSSHSRLEPPPSNESKDAPPDRGQEPVPARPPPPSPATAKGGAPAFDAADVGPDARVIVAGKRGKLWQATVLRRHAKKGAPGFVVHYDGRRRAAEDWVPRDSVVSFLDVDVAAARADKEAEEEAEAGRRQHAPRPASGGGAAGPPRKKRQASATWAGPLGREEKWDRRYQELTAFRDEHGHCNVSRNSHHVLGSWVYNQRLSLRNGTLAEARTARLEALGFVWEVCRGRPPSVAAKQARREAGTRAKRGRPASADSKTGATSHGASRRREGDDDREELASALDLILKDPRFDRDDVDGFKKGVWELARRWVRDKEHAIEDKNAAPSPASEERTTVAVETTSSMPPPDEERAAEATEAASAMRPAGKKPVETTSSMPPPDEDRTAEATGTARSTCAAGKKPTAAATEATDAASATCPAGGKPTAAATEAGDSSREGGAGQRPKPVARRSRGATPRGLRERRARGAAPEEGRGWG